MTTTTLDIIADGTITAGKINADSISIPVVHYASGGYISADSMTIPAIFANGCHIAPTIGLDRLYSDVRKFHVAFGHPVSNTPTIIPQERVAKRATWIREEVQEFEDATTVVDQADACIDIIYFAVGNLVELGVKPQALWNIVQAANMAKLGPDGKPLYHPDGKTRKPEGWQAPEPLLLAEVERQAALTN